MEYIQDKKKINQIMLIFACCYMVSYITRINFGAVILEMATNTGIDRALLSLSVTGSFITYGTGQIVSGICGDKFSPKKLLLFGLGVTSLMNLLIPLCPNAYWMLAVWCVNGFAQAFMWPPMVRMMATFFTPEVYSRSIVRVNWGASVGTILVYLIAPVLISLLSWRAMFVFSAICGIIMMFVWHKGSPDIPADAVFVKHKRPTGNASGLFSPLMLVIMLSIVLMGMLRDGVTTWMPTFISETCNLGNNISILTGVVLPIFTILSTNVSEWLYAKKFSNPVLCSGVIFALGSVASLVLYFLSDKNIAVLSVLFTALLTGSMHGVNLILIGMIPPYFGKKGNVSTASGVLNSCVYIGSAISTYGIAVLTKNVGWEKTLLVWFAIAALGTIICFACTKPWNKQMETEKEA
ncbi:MAG: MFS transporter [Ruminococcaceae bacterium]|nr:MFS transporter [Oscillospiraceae bacterium]